MTLNAKIQVPIPDKGVVVRRSGAYPAVYKVLRSYRNEKGQPTNDRVNIGKFDNQTGKLIPNAKYWEYYGYSLQDLEILPTSDSVRSIGASFLFDHVINYLGVAETLDECLGSKRASLVHTAALYMAARGDVFEGALDYCEEFTLFEKPLAPNSASALFASITFDERMAFFKKWQARQPKSKYLAYDVTSFSTYAKDVGGGEYGYDRDSERLPQINLGCFFSEDSGLPVFYVTYPGSIVDSSHLQYMMAYNNDLDISEVGFVLNSIFCSTSNVQFLAKEGYDFILAVPKHFKNTAPAINLVRDSVVSVDNRVADGVFGVSMKGRFFGISSVMNIYYSPELAEKQRKDLFRTIDSQAETLVQLKKMSEREVKRYSSHFSIVQNEDGSPVFKINSDNINNIMKNFGFFCLLTNTDLNISQTLEKYRRRDIIEKAFDDVKNHIDINPIDINPIDMARLSARDTETTDGKLFCAFISLIVVSEIEAKLRDLKTKRRWNKDSVIKELEKIRLIKGNGGKRLMTLMTKNQRSILEAFGLKDKELKAYVDRGA
jgi:transposase